jgi:hypothetical protein
VPTALRIGAVVLWAGFMLGMVNWSETTAAIVCGAVGTVVLGLVVGRWWVVLAPLVPGLLFALVTLVSDPDDFYEGSPGAWATAFAVVTVAIAALVALGVAIHRSARPGTRGVRRDSL